jgi:hypothetical protein
MGLGATPSRWLVTALLPPMGGDMERQELERWLYDVIQNEDHIYVREEVEGKWSSVALSQLTPAQWAKHVARWLTSFSEDGEVFKPYRVVDE